MTQRALACAALAAFIVSILARPGFAQDAVSTVRVDVTPGHDINSFDPDSALGSSIDVLSRAGIDKVYTPHIIEESLSAGWGPISYRNNSELRMATWHWTENGTWSDSAHQSWIFHRRRRAQRAASLHSFLRAAPPRFLDQWRSPGAGSAPRLLEK